MTASTVTESTAVTLCYIAPIPRPSDTICQSAELVMRQNQSNMSHCTSSHESADMPLLLLSASLSVACPGGIVDGIGAAEGPGGGPAGGTAADMLLLSAWLSVASRGIEDAISSMASVWKDSTKCCTMFFVLSQLQQASCKTSRSFLSMSLQSSGT